MPRERLMAILEMLARDERRNEPPSSLCSTAAEFMTLSGSGISLASHGPHLTTFCASNRVARNLLDLEVMLGEGPGIEARRSDLVLDETELQASGFGRWALYAPEAVAIGVRAVWAYPLNIGALRIGALVLYRDRPGRMSDLQESDAYLLASVVGRAILAERAGVSRRELADELGLELSFDFSVHQAAGMVAVQGGTGLGDAFVALRAHAFGSGVSMTTLARSVVRRETIFDPDTNTWLVQISPDAG